MKEKVKLVKWKNNMDATRAPTDNQRSKNRKRQRSWVALQKLVKEVPSAANGWKFGFDCSVSHYCSHVFCFLNWQFVRKYNDILSSSVLDVTLPNVHLTCSLKPAVCVISPSLSQTCQTVRALRFGGDFPVAPRLRGHVTIVDAAYCCTWLFRNTLALYFVLENLYKWQRRMWM